MNAESERDRRMRDLEQRISVLEQVCAEAYQLAGAVGAPEKALDNLAAAAEGKAIPHTTFLPVSVADCDEFPLAGSRAAGSARKAASPLRA